MSWPLLYFPPPALAVVLAPRLIRTREHVKIALEKNRERIAAVRRPRGKAYSFNVGDAVLLLPPTMGKVGSTIDPRKITCRVVGTIQPHGSLQYRLRCNEGVLQACFPASRLEPAPPLSAAKLAFEGTEWKGLPKISATAAKAAQAIGGGGVISCGCKGTCGGQCRCKRHGVVCSRCCGCKACTGANCGNWN